ncbi:MAG TPA: alpha/beta hydrolase [Caulobacteraceae bacterium]|jgi:pimeloyl-ACP methyl ester carboxylesterase
MRPSRPFPRGALVDIGGRRLHAVRAGPERGGPPLVLLEAGAFGFSADWAAVQAGLAGRGFASIAYDRAGLGLSDPGPAPRDGIAIGADVEALLECLAPTGPLILCGHSMAGLHVHRLALRRRERVVGLVLVDAATPQSMNSKLFSAAVTQFAGLSRLAAWSAGTGLLKPFANTPLGDRIGLDGEVGDHKRWAFADGVHNSAAADEAAQWPAIARQALAAGELDRDWPVAVILAGPPDVRSGLKTLMMAPATASRSGWIEHVASANHASMLASPHADVIVQNVERVCAAAMETEA